MGFSGYLPCLKSDSEEKLEFSFCLIIVEEKPREPFPSRLVARTWAVYREEVVRCLSVLESSYIFPHVLKLSPHQGLVSKWVVRRIKPENPNAHFSLLFHFSLSLSFLQCHEFRRAGHSLISSPSYPAFSNC